MTEKKKRELLRLYISGQITPEDRHALEVAAVDDMFLFEALEGYSTSKDIVSVPYTSKETARVLPIRQMLTMAASFLLIAAMAFIFNQYNTPSINEDAFAQLDNQQLMSESASQKKESATDVTSIEIEDQREGKYDVILQSPSVEVDAIPSEVKEAKTVSNPSVTADRLIKQTAISTKSKEDVFVDSEINEDLVEAGSTYNTLPESPVPEIQIEEQVDSSDDVIEITDLADQDVDTETNSEIEEIVVFADTDIDSETDIQEAEFSTEAAATRARTLPPAAKARKEVRSSGITGIVRDLHSGEPLIGANVIIVGTDSGTITDIDGKFILPYDGTNIDIYVDYIGFETAYVTASLETENEIFLESGQMLDEVVVTGLSNNQKTIPPIESNPVEGKNKLKAFVRESIDKTACTESGLVQLSFLIKSNGKTGQVKVKKAPSKACGEEIKRLFIEFGPWETNPPNHRLFSTWEIEIN